MYVREREAIHTFEPIALPQLPGSDALKAARLIITPVRHRTAVDLVYDAVLETNSANKNIVQRRIQMTRNQTPPCFCSTVSPHRLHY